MQQKFQSEPSIHRLPVTDDIEIFEVRNEPADDAERVYSCVALYRRNWRYDWPALGGTRWLQAMNDGEAPTIEMAREEAASLAVAMFMKNNLIRKAELQLQHRERHLFGWQGGKGVIWTPWEKNADNKNQLTPRRLMQHGRLIESLQGEYIGSKDAGIGAPELRWIERATNYTIGNGCAVDTGDGTAYGVYAGMYTTLRCLGKQTSGTRPLEGVSVLICGLGKVGFPLMKLAHRDGADVSIFEPELKDTSDEALERFWKKKKDARAAVEDSHLAILRDLRGRIFANETDALTAIPENTRGVHFICPAGPRIEWLRESVDGTPCYELLAARSDAAECIVLGPANDQLPMTRDKAGIRDAVLRRLSHAGTLFVPDPVVSPGGVIAVSHELTGDWNFEEVRKDSVQIVEKSIGMLFDLADDKGDSVSLYKAFETLALE